MFAWISPTVSLHTLRGPQCHAEFAKTQFPEAFLPVEEMLRNGWIRICDDSVQAAQIRFEQLPALEQAVSQHRALTVDIPRFPWYMRTSDFLIRVREVVV